MQCGWEDNHGCRLASHYRRRQRLAKSRAPWRTQCRHALEPISAISSHGAYWTRPYRRVRGPISSVRRQVLGILQYPAAAAAAGQWVGAVIGGQTRGLSKSYVICGASGMHRTYYEYWYDSGTSPARHTSGSLYCDQRTCMFVCPHVCPFVSFIIGEKIQTQFYVLRMLFHLAAECQTIYCWNWLFGIFEVVWSNF